MEEKNNENKYLTKEEVVKLIDEMLEEKLKGLEEQLKEELRKDFWNEIKNEKPPTKGNSEVRKMTAAEKIKKSLFS
ncbi:hypothetical protein [Natranaerofaba carboxydovora]|uniref:hypothetical protein n=1 Tax=Natranaerofaba carboxydovora TaxID=2742683 RepID=UPI001F1412C8|nr:hypothetical protein [Natranaerofaba carboxydovora]